MSFPYTYILVPQPYHPKNYDTDSHSPTKELCLSFYLFRHTHTHTYQSDRTFSGSSEDEDKFFPLLTSAIAMASNNCTRRGRRQSSFNSHSHGQFWKPLRLLPWQRMHYLVPLQFSSQWAEKRHKRVHFFHLQAVHYCTHSRGSLSENLGTRQK